MEINLAKEIRKISHLNGKFTLRSGIVTNEYFDKYLFEASPEILNEITKRMVKLIPEGTEVLAGLEMGGIPVVTMLAHHSGLPAAFVRKVAKKHGTTKLAEGASVQGKNVLIVEDVVTSGGQIILSTKDLRDLGANVDNALCVIDRQQGGKEKLSEQNINLLSLFKKEDLNF